ncbi:hypothetical protein [Texas Phoenix palm phytoplasma]|nr:hypothetical protein [Texas Phoenix palm phytoplasma]
MFVAIENISILEIQSIMELAHKKCLISKFLEQYPYFKMTAIEYSKI